MAIGDPFGSLDVAPEEDWRDAEARSNLAAAEAAKPSTRTWADTWHDIGGILPRVGHALGGMANAPVSDESAMSPETYANPLVGGLFNAGAGAVGSGVTAAGDALAGKIPMWDQGGHTSEEAVGRAFDTAALGGGASVAGLAGREALAPSVAAAKAIGMEVPERAAAAPAQLLSDTAKPGAAIAATEHAPPFYSGLERAVDAVPQETMTGKQWLATLENRGAVKGEELDWTGARDFLNQTMVDPKTKEVVSKPITKTELQDHLEQNKVQIGEVTRGTLPEWKDLPGEAQWKLADRWEMNPSEAMDHYEDLRANKEDLGYSGQNLGIPGASKFEEYQLPGGTNYREKLLTVPERNAAVSAELRLADEAKELAWHKANERDSVNPESDPEFQTAMQKYMRLMRETQGGRDDLENYKSPHWEEKNVIAHMRMNDRVMGATPIDAIESKVQAAYPETPMNHWASGMPGKAVRDKVISPEEAADWSREHGWHNDFKGKSGTGTKSLHLEEVQSDWHQAGRQNGYQGSPREPKGEVIHDPEGDAKFPWRVMVEGKEWNRTSGTRERALSELDEGLEDARKKMAAKAPPQGPFAKNWHELALKRALHEAAESGYDRLSWTPGEAQSTSPKVIAMENGNNIPDHMVEQTERTDRGLQGFYNKIVPDYLNKIGKPHGAEVKSSSIPYEGPMSGTKALKILGLPEEHWETVKNDYMARNKLFEDARAKGLPINYLDITPSLRQHLLTKGMPLFEDTAAASPLAVASHAGEANVERSGFGGGDRGVAEAQRAATRLAGAVKPLPGLPDKPITVGGSSYVPGPNEAVHQVAKRYMESTGRPYERADRYHPIDLEHARDIARAYEEMPHAPDDPKVKASYDAMVRETKAQYQALKQSGLKIEAIPPGAPDPYAESPRLAHKDVAENNHLWFFPTETGFGTDEAAGGAKAASAGGAHPLLQRTGEKLGGRELLANDLFRIVHDYFGHLKEGNGFRAAGEDNAWRTHAKMYSAEARPAMTTETRGQNSWLNYGPHGEFNRTASAADTHYAEQKVGLLPDWTMRDREGPSVAALRRATQDPNDVAAAGAKYPQYAEQYPLVGAPQLMDKATNKPLATKGKAAQKLVDQGKAYWAKQLTPEAAAFQKDRAAVQKTMEAKGYEPFFPPEERAHVDPANHPTDLDMTRDALPAKDETIAKYRKMFNTPAARARLQKAYEQGKALGNANGWYAMRQLEDQYVKHLGPEEGRKRFADEFAHTMAATTGGADPTSNLLLAHYVQWASKNGHGIPAESHQLPFPIGGRYVGNNVKQFQKMPEAGGFTEDNPKRHDFGHAFLGHANKATMDEQMSGGLSPGMQIPPGDSYGVAAQVVHDLAKKNGVSPRDFQDVAWAGLKKMKGGGESKGPMIQHVNDAIERTHRLTGAPRNEIVRRGLVKKETPLYSAPIPVPFGALDAQEQNQ